jgi:membrane-associated HD superfamily phosphohydrolase
MVELPVWIILTIATIGVIVMLVLLGNLQKEKDANSEIDKTIVLYASVSAVFVLLFGVACYIYFSSNMNYSTPFIIVMLFMNTFLSIVAVAASTQQVIHS